MSLFLCGNSAEMRETEGNSAGEKHRGMEMSLLYPPYEIRTGDNMV